MGAFIDIPGRQVRLRSRASMSSASLKKPDMLPPAELRAAMLDLLAENSAAQREELITGTARLLGFGATGAQLRRVIEQELDGLVEDGAVTMGAAGLQRVDRR